jgi:uracil phosphoribosyltransferase
MLTDWGLSQSQIKIISVLGSKQGVEHVSEEYPDVEVCTAGFPYRHWSTLTHDGT